MTTEQTQALSRTFIYLGVLLIGTISASVLASGVSLLFFGSGVSVTPGMPVPSDPASWWQLHLQNFISQAIGFGGTAWVAWRLWKDVPEGLLGNPAARKANVLGLAILATVFSSPLLAASYELNTHLIPEGGMLETLFLPLEKMLEALTTFIASAEGAKRLVVLFSVAALPAVFEELAFRGVLQPLLIRVTGHAWIGIVLASVIFSAIHFQFYGFLPRVLLGMLFGWLAYRSGSLIPGMAAHFVNNALAAVTLWLTGSMSEDLLDVTTPLILLSLVLTGALIWGLDRVIPRASGSA
jgi:membrane protease YdiL (CAAX protease family)